MSRYLVTGATGFLGRHLVATLAQQGHSVRALSRGGDHPGVAGVEAIAANVLDKAALQRAMKDCDGVFHCAGKVSRDPRDAEELFRVHVHGTRATLEAARSAGIRRVVVASTSGTVGISEDAHQVAIEEDPAPIGLIQRFPYYRSKLYAEQEAFEHDREGLEVLCVNPSLLLGPGDIYGSSTHDVRLFLDQAIPFVPTGGLAFVDARDAAEAMVLAMHRGQRGRRYLVNACNLTVKSFFERLERISGVPAPKVPMPRSRSAAVAGRNWFGRVVSAMGGEFPVDEPTVEVARLFWYVDSGRAEKELGWKPRDPNETLADTVRELRPEN